MQDMVLSSLPVRCGMKKKVGIILPWISLGMHLKKTFMKKEYMARHLPFTDWLNITAPPENLQRLNGQRNHFNG